MYVPQETIVSILGDRSRFAIPLASLIGVPLYLGNLSALPIVKGLHHSRDAAGRGHCLPDRGTRHNHPGHDGGVDCCP